jgi:hypothetical protein
MVDEGMVVQAERGQYASLYRGLLHRVMCLGSCCRGLPFALETIPCKFFWLRCIDDRYGRCDLGNCRLCSPPSFFSKVCLFFIP